VLLCLAHVALGIDFVLVLAAAIMLNLTFARNTRPRRRNWNNNDVVLIAAHDGLAFRHEHAYDFVWYVLDADHTADSIFAGKNLFCDRLSQDRDLRAHANISGI